MVLQPQQRVVRYQRGVAPCIGPRYGHTWSHRSACDCIPSAFDSAARVQLRLVRITVVTHDEPPSGRNGGKLTFDEGQQVGFGHVLQVRPNEIVLPSRLPVKRVRNLEAVLARRKALARQFHELRHQVDPVRSDDESFLSRPDDQRLEQQAVRTADVEEVAVAVQRPNEESSRLLPTSSPAAPPGLLVLIGRIREIELDNGVAKDTKVLVPRGVAS
jgi:hypothetical protein